MKIKNIFLLLSLLSFSIKSTAQSVDKKYNLTLNTGYSNDVHAIKLNGKIVPLCENITFIDHRLSFQMNHRLASRFNLIDGFATSYLRELNPFDSVQCYGISYLKKHVAYGHLHFILGISYDLIITPKSKITAALNVNSSHVIFSNFKGLKEMQFSYSSVFKNEIERKYAIYNGYELYTDVKYSYKLFSFSLGYRLINYNRYFQNINKLYQQIDKRYDANLWRFGVGYDF
jgi:hypothetical protein